MHITWSWLLITLSYIISVFGSFTALELARRIPRHAQRAVTGWLAAAALAMGGGAIWSMHFIGMLAARMDMRVSYDPWTTLASLAVAIAATGVGLWLVASAPENTLRLIGGGTFTGLGVAGMHYLGMAAMRMPADIVYDTTLVAVSIVIAVVAATAAFWLAFIWQRGFLSRLGSALIMGLAVCGMHYTGMAAATLVDDGKPSMITTSALVAEDLAFYVFLATVSVLAIVLFVALRQNLSEEPA